MTTLPLLTDGDTEPVFAPNGRLAFTGVKSGKKNIYIVGGDGSGLKQLTFAGGSAPAWSSKNRIAFVRDGFLYSINPDGSGKKKLRRGDEPDYSPQGDRIIYQRTFDAGTPNAKTSLFILRSAKKFRRFTNGRGFAPSWSPGGGTIAYGRPSAPDDRFAPNLVRIGLNKQGYQVLNNGQGGFDSQGSTNLLNLDPAWQTLPK